MKQGTCATHGNGRWKRAENPDVCLEGSRAIDDKTLTVNSKVRFTRSKHDQSGCSWDKGGHMLLFNDYKFIENPEDEPKCDDTFAEDPSRSGCICTLTAERCDAVHGEAALDIPDITFNNENEPDFCLCGQNTCGDEKYCYEKMSQCKNTDSAFTCNLFEDQCWPEDAQRISLKKGVMGDLQYKVGKIESVQEDNPVCPEGEATNGRCICGDQFKVLPVICEATKVCHHRMSTCYSEKQTMCPTHVYNTEHAQCLCGLKSHTPEHLMNVYEQLDDATEPEGQSKFFDSIMCSNGQLCVLRSYSDSLKPEAECVSETFPTCVAYPEPSALASCACGTNIALRGQYCFKGQVKSELHPYCDNDRQIFSECYCPNSAAPKESQPLLEEGDGNYCDLFGGASNCGESGNLPCGEVEIMSNLDCPFTDILTASNTDQNLRCACRNNNITTICAATQQCGLKREFGGK